MWRMRIEVSDRQSLESTISQTKITRKPNHFNSNKSNYEIFKIKSKHYAKHNWNILGARQRSDQNNGFDERTFQNIKICAIGVQIVLNLDFHSTAFQSTISLQWDGNWTPKQYNVVIFGRFCLKSKGFGEFDFWTCSWFLNL